MLCSRNYYEIYPEKVTCLKCNDKFFHVHGYSQRLSCRIHHFNNNSLKFCIYCHETNPRGNCYHIKKDSWF